MRAVVFRAHGGPEVLELADVDTPEPGPGEVRVSVRAVALNHLDLWVRNGWPGLRLPLPHILGSDIAGVVDALGPGTGHPHGCGPGEPVLVQPGVSCGMCEECLLGRDHHCAHYGILGEDTTGGYAEHIVVAAKSLLPMPKNLSFEEAACVPVTFLTAWQMLVTRAQVRPGEWVLVQAAGSGVGIAAIQIARLFGARVIATASSDEKLARAAALGAEQVINYATSDFAAEVKKHTNGSGIDVVVEHVGGAVFEKSLRVLKRGGRLVTCGASSGAEVKVDLRHLFIKKFSVLGSTMGSKGELAQMMPLFARGALKPVLDRTYPLEEAQDAHRRLADRAQFGKIVLVI